jgi:peptidoglycan/LPS O-acetylase OafA/YrhL
MAGELHRKPVPSPEAHHLRPLDGLRGIAILMVLLTHAFEANYQNGNLLVRTVGYLCETGHFGVDLFFVLSGFLITGILIDTRNDPLYFRRFFARRALRILPLYYGVLLVLMAIGLPLHWHWNGMLPLLLTYTQNLRPAAINSMAVGPGIALYHFWTLAIEEQFYLVWPWIVYALAGRVRSVAVVSLWGSIAVLALRLLLASRGVNFLTIHMDSLTRADSLLIGGGLAAAYRSTAAWGQVSRCSKYVFVALLALMAGVSLAHAFSPLGATLWYLGIRYSVLAVDFAALLAWTLRPGSLAQWICERRWLRVLGKYSYGIYVLHVLIFSLFELRLRSLIRDLTGNKLLAVAGSAFALMLVSLGAAFVSYQLYEKRWLRLKHKFKYSRLEPARIEVEPSAVASGNQEPGFGGA